MDRRLLYLIKSSLTLTLLESSADNLLANTSDPDQARQNIGPNLDQIFFDTGDIPESCFFGKLLILKKKSSRRQNMINMINYSFSKESMNS